ncbi:MAG: hypothetical protein Q8Q49_01630 [bacterium]|nr:hypothetical protein [bacterium]
MNTDLQQELQHIFDADYSPAAVQLDLSLMLRLTEQRRKEAKKIEVMKAWLEDAEARHVEKEAKIDSFLEQFMLSYFLETNAKTLVLPNGFRLSLREKSDKVDILDEVATIAWAKGFTDEGFIKTKESIVVKMLIKHIKETGEIPPGAKFIPGDGLSFSCKDKGG